MLDSKDIVYIREILNLVDIIMKKVPEKFIVSFLREGVVENINKIITSDKDMFYLPEEKSNVKYIHSEKDIIDLEKEVNKHMNESDHDKRKEIKKTMLELLKKKGKHSRLFEREDDIADDNNYQIIVDNNVIIEKKSTNEEKNDDIMLELKQTQENEYKLIPNEKKEIKEETSDKKKGSSYQETVVSNVNF